MLNINVKAPAFTLPDQDGKPVSLSDFAGRRVVLYFYPQDNTPGCTIQACKFTETKPDFDAVDAVVIGVSKDSAQSHRAFQDEHGLKLILLSDTAREVIEAYDVWDGENVNRTTYIISAEGVVEKVMPDVDFNTNAADVLAYLKGLSKSKGTSITKV